VIDLFEGRKLSKSVKEDISAQVGQYLVEQTSISISEKKSPIKGEAWKKALSPEYAKLKLREVGNKESNLEFTGTMLDELTFEPTKEGVKIGVIGDRAPAADGHNNLSGKSSLPQRRFLPAEGQEYKGPIMKEVERIVADALASNSNVSARTFKGITPKKELYAKLNSIVGGGLSGPEIRLAVYRNDDLLDALKESGALDYL